MKAHISKIVGEGLTYDDVLLIPNYSEVLPREVNIQSKISRNISLNVPVVSFFICYLFLTISINFLRQASSASS